MRCLVCSSADRDVAFLLDPIVVLLGKNRPDKPDDRFPIREDAHAADVYLVGLSV